MRERAPIKTTIKQAIEYWVKYVDECDLSGGLGGSRYALLEMRLSKTFATLPYNTRFIGRRG